MEYDLPEDAETARRREISGEAALPSLKLDPSEYRADLAEFDMTEEQENELLEVLWNIMSTFVLMGWGLDTVQMFLPDIFKNSGQDSEKLLGRKGSETFNQVTACAGKERDDANDAN